MDELTGMRVFRQVVESGSFVGAADRLGVSTPRGQQGRHGPREATASAAPQSQQPQDESHRAGPALFRALQEHP